jgi:hypothetical protein
MTAGEMQRLDTAFKIHNQVEFKKRKPIASFKDVFESFINMEDLQKIVNQQ